MNARSWQALVAEDDYDSLQVVKELLSSAGAEVITATTGKQCLKLLQETTPAMLVLDLAMPEMDGWEVLRQVRANPVTADIPVIAVTAYDSANVHDDALQAGFNAYFSKPLRARDFLTCVNQMIHRNNQ